MKVLFATTNPAKIKRYAGYPLDSMSIMPEFNKYFVDLTEEDRNKNKEDYKENDVINFIANNV